MKTNKILTTLFMTLAIFAFIVYSHHSNRVKNDEKRELDTVQLAACVDGDTARLIIEGVEEKVRFLAIDTPETKHPDKAEEEFGKEASDRTCEILSSVARIEIEYDKNSDRKDKYDRVLAWIWVDGQLLQEILISEGLAKVDYIYGDYLYVDYLRGVEEEAKENMEGLWG